MTRYDYIVLAQKEVNDSSTSSYEVFQNIVREIYQEVVREAAPYVTGSVSETLAAIVGTSGYTPTNSYTDIQAVHYKDPNTSDYNELEQITEEDYLSNHVNDSNSTPTKWLLRGGDVVVAPPPSSAGTIRIQGVVRSNELDDDAEVSIIPDDFSRVIVLGAVYRFLAHEKDIGARDYYNWYLTAKREMIRELATRTRPIKPTLYGK